MNVLEKILEEIEEVTFQEDAPIYIGDMAVDGYVRMGRVEEIIRSHMDDCKTFEFDFNKVKSFDCQCGRHYVNTCNDDWIPVEEGLPEETGYYLVQLSRKLPNEDYSDMVVVLFNGIEKEFMCYANLIIAWRPLPEPYKPAESKSTKNTQQKMEDFWMDK